MNKTGNWHKKFVELVVFSSIIGATILAGCSGSSSSASSNSTPAAVKVTVTPGKGIMIGANITVQDANLNTIVTGLTNASGVAAVDVPSAATAPFVILVTCTSSCSYYDEKTSLMMPGVDSAAPMRSVVPSAGITDIGVNAATNAAAQYALATLTTGTALTAANVASANNTVVAALGLPAGTNLLTPPAIISDAATLSAAQQGTGTANILASFSAAMSIASASGVSALDTIAAYGTAWQVAAITPASGVIMPASIDLATLATASSGVTVTSTINVATIAATVTAATASAVADANAMMAEAAAGELKDWWNTRYSTAAAPTTYTNDVRVGYTIPTVSGNTYTFANSTNYMSRNNGAWTAFTPTGGYNLLAAGWSNADGGVVVNNLDGTLTVTPTGQASTLETVTRTNLSGTAIPCEFYAPTACASAVYPTGSYSYASNYTSTVDQYSIRTMSGGLATIVTDASGVQLTSLPAAGATLCVSYGRGGSVFVYNGAPTGDNYNVYGTWSCSATDIASAITGTAQGTVLLSAQATNNSVVPGVGLVTVSGANLASLSWMNNKIIGVLNGLVYPGERNPAGPQSHMSGKNTIAIDAELIANGFISTTATPSTPAAVSIVGTWRMTQYPDTTPASIDMVLLADGRYMFISTLTGSCQAMESGSYTHNAATGALDLSVTYDTSSTCGMLQGATPTVAAPLVISRNFSTATGALTSTAGGVQGTFAKLPQTATEVGTWLFAAGAQGDFTLNINHADGSYIYAEAPSAAFPDPVASGRGMEYGAYIVGTGTYTFNTVVYDGNGPTSGVNALAGIALAVTPGIDADHSSVTIPGATPVILSSVRQ